MSNRQRQHRRVWSQQEDQLLKGLVEEHGEQKIRWNDIAAELSETLNFDIPRNAKQCRERWINLRNSDAEANRPWTKKDDLQMISAIKNVGHRWARLAQELGNGRSDNCLKNHFYSTLRRITRLLDKFIKDEKKKYRQMIKSKQDIPDKTLYDEFDKIRGIEVKNFSKIFSLVDSKMESRYEPVKDIAVDQVREINNEVLEMLSTFIEADMNVESMDKLQLMEILVKILKVSRETKKKYHKECKLSILRQEQLEEQQICRKKIERKQQKLINKYLQKNNSTIIPTKQTKKQILEQLSKGKKNVEKMPNFEGQEYSESRELIKQETLIMKSQIDPNNKISSFYENDFQLKQIQQNRFNFLGKQIKEEKKQRYPKQGKQQIQKSHFISSFLYSEGKSEDKMSSFLPVLNRSFNFEMQNKNSHTYTQRKNLIISQSNLLESDHFKKENLEKSNNDDKRYNERSFFSDFLKDVPLASGKEQENPFAMKIPNDNDIGGNKGFFEFDKKEFQPLQNSGLILSHTSLFKNNNIATKKGQSGLFSQKQDAQGEKRNERSFNFESLKESREIQKIVSPLPDQMFYPLQHFSFMSPGGIFTSQQMARPLVAPIDHSLTFSNHFPPTNLLDSQSMFLQRSMNQPSHISEGQIDKSSYSIEQDKRLHNS